MCGEYTEISNCVCSFFRNIDKSVKAVTDHVNFTLTTCREFYINTENRPQITLELKELFNKNKSSPDKIRHSVAVGKYISHDTIMPNVVPSLQALKLSAERQGYDMVCIVLHSDNKKRQLLTRISVIIRCQSMSCYNWCVKPY